MARYLDRQEQWQSRKVPMRRFVAYQETSPAAAEMLDKQEEDDVGPQHIYFRPGEILGKDGLPCDGLI
jgi:hypothetical protein